MGIALSAYDLTVYPIHYLCVQRKSPTNLPSPIVSDHSNYIAISNIEIEPFLTDTETRQLLLANHQLHTTFHIHYSRRYDLYCCEGYTDYSDSSDYIHHINYYPPEDFGLDLNDPDIIELLGFVQEQPPQTTALNNHNFYQSTLELIHQRLDHFLPTTDIIQLRTTNSTKVIRIVAQM